MDFDVLMMLEPDGHKVGAVAVDQRSATVTAAHTVHDDGTHAVVRSQVGDVQGCLPARGTQRGLRLAQRTRASSAGTYAIELLMRSASRLAAICAACSATLSPPSLPSAFRWVASQATRVPAHGRAR